MSLDDELWEYEGDEPDASSGDAGGGRRGAYWTAGIAIAVLSLIAGFVIGGRRDAAPREASDVGTVTASGSPTASGESGSATPGSSVSSSATPSQSAAFADPASYAGLLAAIAANGDVVLVDPETAAVAGTLVRNDDAALPQGEPQNFAGLLSWHAKTGTVYFSRSDCSIWRHVIQTNVTERVAAGRIPAISPDGTRLALATCAQAGGALAVVDAATGTVTLSIPISTAALDQGGGMVEINAIDWRPDGRGLIVTEGWEGDDVQYFVDVNKPPKSVHTASAVPVKGVNGSFHSVDYVGQRLVMAGTCCPPDEATALTVVRDGKTGNATKIAPLSDVGLIEPTADAQGRLRYLRRESPDGPAVLWALDTLDGVPRQIGGEFRAVDW
jgi:hypothetical protein